VVAKRKCIVSKNYTGRKGRKSNGTFIRRRVAVNRKRMLSRGGHPGATMVGENKENPRTDAEARKSGDHMRYRQTGAGKKGGVTEGRPINVEKGGNAEAARPRPFLAHMDEYVIFKEVLLDWV